MKLGTRKRGSVFLIVVFAVALLATITIGILEMSTEELMLMQNQLYLAQALATAEAGLNDAFAQIRTNSSWTAGFTNKAFGSDTYTVIVDANVPLPNRTITSTATTSQGYVGRVRANVTIGATSPYIIRVDNLRINE